MTHDIQDLLNLIKELEKRIVELERASNLEVPLDMAHWYWDH